MLIERALLKLKTEPIGLRAVERVIWIDVKAQRAEAETIERDDAEDALALLDGKGIEKSPCAGRALHVSKEESMHARRDAEGVIDEGHHERASPVIDGALTCAFMFVVGDEEDDARTARRLRGLAPQVPTGGQSTEQIFAAGKRLHMKVAQIALKVMEGLL